MMAARHRAAVGRGHTGASAGQIAHGGQIMAETGERGAVLDRIGASLEAMRAEGRAEYVGGALSGVVLRVHSDGALSLSGRYGDGTPADEWHGVVLGLACPVGIIPSALADWLGERREALADLCGGMDRRWDGSNWVGTLGEDGREAEEELQAGLLELGEYPAAAVVSPQDASDYLAPIRSDLAGLGSAAEAEAMALSDLDADGITDWGEGPVYVGRDEAAREARRIWDEARGDE